ncbi:hypothetical protein [Rhizobium sp. GN54]|uniref:hypothetical protein n=1 Tax=Rhizobium sp. GN54 TaxID=2898150 RepID=UPI001E363529|nr:hypothetical protein [Rhizobium sp. GN54]MCD2184474.1 hypothetical protein [Rhizobium sp. GN54]
MKTGGKQAYFATARITDIIPDPSKPDHFYALIADFLHFSHAVPFKEADLTTSAAYARRTARPTKVRSAALSATFPTPSMT